MPRTLDTDLVSLREAAADLGTTYDYARSLPSRYKTGRTPFPAPAPDPERPGRPRRNDAGETLYRLTDLTTWWQDRKTGRPRVRPEQMSDLQWRTLVAIADAGATQVPPGPRFYGTHPIEAAGQRLDPRVVGSLMVEGWVRGVGKRGSLRYEVTGDGRALVRAHPDLAAAVRS